MGWPVEVCGLLPPGARLLRRLVDWIQVLIRVCGSRVVTRVVADYLIGSFESFQATVTLALPRLAVSDAKFSAAAIAAQVANLLPRDTGSRDELRAALAQELTGAQLQAPVALLWESPLVQSGLFLRSAAGVDLSSADAKTETKTQRQGS